MIQNTTSSGTNLKKPFNVRFNFKEEIFKYLKKWYWFVLSFLVFGSLAFIYLRYTISQYSVSATIAISDDKSSVSDLGLATYNNLGVIDTKNDKQQSEIQVLKSQTLIKNIVERKKLNIQYFSEGKILETEVYPDAAVEIDFLSADSIINTRSKDFFVRIDSKTKFSLVTEEEEKISEHFFGKTFKTNVGGVVITPNNKIINSSIGKIIRIKLTPVKNVVESFKNRLDIYGSQQASSILNLTLSDPIVNRAADFLNTLIEDYGQTTIARKKEISNKTADFIRERLSLINEDLLSVEGEAAGYKSKFGVAGDISAQTERVAGFDSQNAQAIKELETQLRLIQSMQNFIQSQDAENSVIPGNLGLDDPSIVSNISRYNSLVIQRKRLLKTSSIRNPVVININEEINSIRQGLKTSLNTLRSSIKIKLNSLETSGKYFSGKLYVAPKRQMDLRAIEREQTVKEQLYLYLLQKREEAELTSHITVPNSRVIDKASPYSAYLISPNKKKTYFGAAFIAFIIPFLGIYVSDLLNTKLRSKDELEGMLSVPVLGSIPKSKIKNKIILSRNDRSPISESFRILQTNLNFFLAEVQKPTGKVIFVTSSISGEGKTFISSNLAKTLAVSGFKVAYVGTDFRYPKLHEFVELPEGKNTIGFTSYITNENLREEDVIYSQNEEDSIDLVPAGVIPPNPTGLLMHRRVKQMFSYLEANYDYIVVDTSPVGLVTDTLIISKFADTTIYVAREDYTDKRLLSFPEKFFKEKRLANLAMLFNAESSTITSNYGYGEK